MRTNAVTPEAQVISTQPNASSLNTPTIDELGDFSGIQVITVPRPSNYCLRLSNTNMWLGVGLFASSAIAIAGSACLPWTVLGINKTLSVGAACGSGITGGIPGVSCAISLGVWSCLRGSK